MAETSLDERRWTRGAWLTLVAALLAAARSLVVMLAGYAQPSEGWVVNRLDDGRIEYVTPLVADSSLRAGDILHAVDGVPIEAIAERAHAFFRLVPPDWQAGTVLRYTVLRNGAPVTINVTLTYVTFTQVYASVLTAQGLGGWFELASPLFFFIVGVIVFALRPRERAARALFLVGAGFLWNAGLSPYGATTYFYPLTTVPPSIPLDTWTFLINPSLAYVGLVFPLPKWPVRRFPRLTVAVLYLGSPVALNLAYLLNIGDRTGYQSAAAATYFAGIAVTMLAVVGGLLHSAFTVRGATARAQLSWTALGLVSFTVVGVGAWAIAYILGSASATPIWVLFLGQTGWLLMPVCLAIAITRTRLLDIDVIIRRTLVYSMLTGLLALTYFGLIVVLQGLVGAFGGARPEWITVASTLAVAALVLPLRNRIQAFIDRRFFRHKYNAQQVLAEFAAAARDETDLGALTERLAATVRAALQPESTSVWLKPPDAPPAAGDKTA